MKRPSSYPHLPFSSLVGRAALFQWIKEFLNKCNIQGGYFEFGVLNGESMCEAYFILRDQVDRYIGFDAFEGLPPLSQTDEFGLFLQPDFIEGNFKSMSYEFVYQTILSTGLAPDKLLLVKGFFEETLTMDLQSQLLPGGRASVVHLDVDLYVSTKQALEFIYPFFQTGTWLLCDDYWTYAGASSFGTQKALKEFLAEHPDILLQEYCSYRGWSKAFIVERIS